MLDQLLEVAAGSRISDLERWRKNVAPRSSGPTVIKALDQVADEGLKLADLGAEALVPPRRLGELSHRYERGLENQLGALDPVLNCVTLWTTVYLDAAVRRLKDQGYPVREEDLARPSPFVHSHLGVHGTYTFALPELAPGAIREPRDPETAEDDEI
ncbi:Tn3 family transposase [Nocardiopsis alborubida]|uniref:Tn3 family transposase n=1 Tax=Nocardiopsis alborubida TaxID=146802 RepID=UPI00076E43AF|nr:Tn3 family transposase [Nocardiopsis alborubida]